MEDNTLALPADFLARMRQLLSTEEYESFVASYERPPRSGLRVNTLKIGAAELAARVPFALSPVGAFEPAGFLVEEGARPGRHPYHAAGLYYLQDPSTMVVGAMLAPQPGELVLDLAAAPGGKATHLATQLEAPLGDPQWGNDSLLVANDVSRQRARLLLENLERWGARQALVTSAEPEQLAATFGAVFDRVLLDAPCSGEGMLRRREGDVEWSEAIVAACARRQADILQTAAQLTRPGGLLLYSTCTFAPEENEEVIGRFLVAHPDFELQPLPDYPGFARGRPEWAADGDPLFQRAVRLWPHQFPGEGHFLALLRRTEDTAVALFTHKRFARIPPDRKELQLWRGFAQETLRVELPVERLHLAGGRLYLLPKRALDSGRLRMLRYGLLLGEVRHNYFRPAHALALALTPQQVQHTVNWTADDPRTAAYLAGHDMAQESASVGTSGWVLVTVDGYGLGWGKRGGGRLKNHYPHSLRRH